MEHTSIKKRILYYDIMRIFAIFFVVFIHTGENGLFLFSRYTERSISFWADLFLSVFSSFSVPLFFAVSGALMLNRPDESMKDLFRKRFARFAVILAAISLLYYCQSKDFDPKRIQIKEYIIVLYSYSAGTVTWFLYSYLAYLLTLPFLRTLARGLKDHQFYYLFAISLVVNGFLPIVEYLVFHGNQTLNPAFTVGWITEKIVVYPLLGYFLEERLKKRPSGKQMACLWTVNVLLIIASCAMTVCLGKKMGTYEENISEQFFGNFELVNCAVIYLTVRVCTESWHLTERVQKWLQSLGEGTFGVFLLHMFVMNWPISQQIRLALVHTGMGPMLACLLYCLYIMAVSYIVTFLLKKLPGVKKLL